MNVLKTDNFIVEYSNGLENYAKKSVQRAEKKKKEFCKLFNCKSEEIGILKASFFNVREDFVNHIKQISGGSEPPIWAEGCFYNGEIQAMVRKEVEFERLNTLAHETLHLFFNKTIYMKYNIDRIRWLDESFAVFLDGTPEDVSCEEFKEIVSKIRPLAKGFNMNDLNDINKVNTKEYDGYDMFEIIGRYIFVTKQEQKLLELIKKDRNQVVEIGTHILIDAINFFEKFLNYTN